MNQSLAGWVGLVWTQTWQVSAAALAAGLIVRLCCRRRPRLAYALWMLVVFKALVPPLWSSPTSVFSWAGSSGRVIAAPTSRLHRLAADIPASAQATAAAAHDPRVDPSGGDRVAIGFAGLWLFGCAGLAAWIILGHLITTRRIARSAIAPPREVAALMAEIAREIGLKQRVELVVSRAPIGPAVCGPLRPRVLLPAVMLGSTSPAELRLILAHELTHIRRGDLLAGWIQLAAQLVWWFHPLVWWANRQACRERERACDLDVVAGSGCRPLEYARVLLGVIERNLQCQSPVTFPGLRALEVTSRRLELIMQHAHSQSRWSARVAGLAFAAGIAVLIPGAGLDRDQDAPARGQPNAPRSGASSAAARATAIAQDEGQAEIIAVQARLQVKERRLEWARRMWQKGYVSRAVLHAEERAFQQARTEWETALAAVRTVSIKGVVREKATHRPLAGVRVTIASAEREPGSAVTDRNGRYSIDNLPGAREYSITALPPRGEPYFIASRTISEQIPASLDLELIRGIPFRVRVVDNQTGKPVRGSIAYFPLSPNDPFARGVNGYVTGGKATIGAFYESEATEDGEFFGAVLAGPGILCFRYPYEAGDESRTDFPVIVEYPDGKAHIKLTDQDREHGPMAFVPIQSAPIAWGALPLQQYAGVLAIDPRPGAESVLYELKIPPRKPTK